MDRLLLPINLFYRRCFDLLKNTTLAGFSILILVSCAADGISRSTGEVIDDTSISSRLKTALLADSTTDGLDIEVEIFRGRVQLIGFVDSQEQIALAQEIARTTNGVVSVSSALHLVEQSRRVGEFIDDSVLVTRITTALASEPAVRMRSVEIEANRGTVILGGFVDSMDERDLAGSVARGVNGAERVYNHLELR